MLSYCNVNTGGAWSGTVLVVPSPCGVLGVGLRGISRYGSICRPVGTAWVGQSLYLGVGEGGRER